MESVRYLIASSLTILKVVQKIWGIHHISSNTGGHFIG